jgi:hypothetical protein
MTVLENYGHVQNNAVEAKDDGESGQALSPNKAHAQLGFGQKEK